jgi:uncharacterized MAPEG superfamily protein
MTIPVWVLLAFALWTLLILAATVGVYRWTRILAGRVGFSEYAEYRIEGEDWYKRAMRAHANCVENLPVYGAIVVVLLATGIEGTFLDALALVVIGARVLHTLVHVAFEQTNAVTFCRSMLFNLQYLAMIAMGIEIVMRST